MFRFLPGYTAPKATCRDGHLTWPHISPRPVSESASPGSGFQGQPFSLESDLCPLLCFARGREAQLSTFPVFLHAGLHPAGTVPSDAQEWSRVSEVARLLLWCHWVRGAPASCRPSPRTAARKWYLCADSGLQVAILLFHFIDTHWL